MKHQLRALIIEIRKLIEMIRFKATSLWDYRVYKNPLKKIVIDMAEIEKLMAKNKKRSRDRHEPASTWNSGHRGNSLESQKASSDKEGNLGNDSLGFAKSSKDSLKFEQPERVDAINPNADKTSNIDYTDVSEIRNVNVNENEDIFMKKFERENSIKASRETERSDSYIKSSVHPAKFPKEAKGTRTSFTTNMSSYLKLNDLIDKLIGDRASYKLAKKTLVSDPEVKDENGASEGLVISADHGFKSKGKVVKTIHGRNANLGLDLNIDRERAYGKSTGENRQKFEGEVEGGINNNPDLLTQNWTPLGFIGKKSEEISPDDSEVGNKAGANERDTHGSADLSLSCTDLTGDEDIPTKDKRINRQINSDVSIAEENNKDELKKSYKCAPSANRVDDERDLENINYNFTATNPPSDLEITEDGRDVSTFKRRHDKVIRDIYREVDCSDNTTTPDDAATENDSLVINDNNVEGTVDECNDLVLKISDDTRSSATGASTDDKNLPQKLASVGANLNVNATKLITSKRGIRKSRNAPQPSNDVRDAPPVHSNEKRCRFDGKGVSVTRSESKVDEKGPNSMDIMIDAVDEVLPADTSRTVTCGASRNFKGRPKKERTEEKRGDILDAR